MAAYIRVYDSHHLQADRQEPGSPPEPYAQQLNMGYLYLSCYGIVWSGRRRVERRTVDRSDSCDRGRRRSASDRHRKHCADRETQDRTRCQPCRLVVVLLLFFAHQHKAAGRKTRQDIQNYGSNVNLLCDHGVVKETAFPLCRAAAHKKAQNKRDKYSKLASTHFPVEWHI